MINEASKIRSALAQHFGTDAYHAYPRGIDGDGPLLTDGALEMARLCRAFWLIDLIASAQRDQMVSRELFQVWSVAPDRGNGSAAVTCTDGNGEFLTAQEIADTNFPLPEGITLWKEGEVILLPNEH
jgi:hypothetical protein